MSHNVIIDNRAADADLLTRVSIALTLRGRPGLRLVHVLVGDGSVTLRGRVPTYYDRQLAIEVTRRVAGVRQIRDELTVAVPTFDGWAPTTAAANGHQASESSSAHASDGAGTEAGRRVRSTADSRRTSAASGRAGARSSAVATPGAQLPLGLVLASLFLLAVVWVAGNMSSVAERGRNSTEAVWSERV